MEGEILVDFCEWCSHKIIYPFLIPTRGRTGYGDASTGLQVGCTSECVRDKVIEEQSLLHEGVACFDDAGSATSERREGPFV
jgi:hypothetical protein